MMDKLMVLASKMSSNRYLGAIRDAFICIVPLTITASFAILINNVFLGTNLPFSLANPDYYSASMIEVVVKIKFIFDTIAFGSLEIMSLLVVFTLAYNLAKQSEVKSPLVNAAIIFGVFYSLFPKGGLVSAYYQNQWVEGFKEAANAVNLGGLTGATNLFTAIIVGIIFSELLIWLQGFDKLKITLPEQVPPAVANAFSSLFPAFLTMLVAGIVATIFMLAKPFGYGDLSAFISGMFQAPFLALARTNIGGWGIMLIYIFSANFLWIFGLHGPNILAGFSQPTLGVLAATNTTTYAATGNAYGSDLAVFTAGFVDSYVQLGGSGATLGLIIAVFIASKRADYKVICRLSLMPGIFEINEPITFGLPIVLNPIMAIPFVVAPLALVILPGLLTTLGILPKIVISVPWVTPPIIGAFLATGANPLAALVALINLGIATLIYLPFVLMANRQYDKDALEEQTTV
ncbi:MAG: PTS sugar transporter subunit IIC [Culicoidibacterales bacterium]